MNAVKSSAQSAQRKHNKFPASYVFRRDPWNHQLAALNFAYGNDATALFMEMRTGKSKVIVDLFTERFLADEIELAVVVCPMSVRKTVWEVALNHDSPVSFDSKLFSTKDRRPLILDWVRDRSARTKWLLVSIESLSQGKAAATIEALLRLCHGVAICVDESSSIKNDRANRTQACYSFGRHASLRVILTGTPITKNLQDLYSQFQFLDPNIIGIGDAYSFRNRYLVMGGYNNKQLIGYQNVDELMTMIAPHSFEVRKADALPDIPDKQYERRVVTMTPEQKRLYDGVMVGVDIINNNFSATVNNILTVYLYKQQITSFFMSSSVVEPVPGTGKNRKVRRINRIKGQNPKMQELVAVLAESDLQTIIWSRFVPEIEEIVSTLKKEFGNGSVVTFYGETSEDERSINVDKFQNHDARFIVGNPATGRFGLELSAAGLVIYMSNSFDLEHRIQSEERPMSSKQKHVVKFIDIVCGGTIDELVLESYAEKANVAEFVSKCLREHRFEKLRI